MVVKFKNALALALYVAWLFGARACCRMKIPMSSKGSEVGRWVGIVLAAGASRRNSCI